jgi:hypothetical protein
MRLNEYAKKWGVKYKTALLWVKDGRIDATRLLTGTIIVKDGESEPKEKGTYTKMTVDTKQVTAPTPAPTPAPASEVKAGEAAYADAVNVLIEEIRGLRTDIKAYMTDTVVAAEQVAEPATTPST